MSITGAPFRHSRQLLLLALISLLLPTAALAQVPTNYVDQDQDLPCLNKTLSLVVHVIDNPPGFPNDPLDQLEFEAMVEFTNTFFEPICLSFEVCEYRVIPNSLYATFEDNDGSEVDLQNQTPRQLDVYVTRDDSAGRCGLASPGEWVMVSMPCIDSTSLSLAHELGTYFGLLDTNVGFGEENVDGSNCETAGDLICDTPADPYDPSLRVQWLDLMDPCRFVYRGRDANGQFYTPDVGNIMSPYENCRCSFSYDQLAAIAEACRDADPNPW